MLGVSVCSGAFSCSLSFWCLHCWCFALKLWGFFFAFLVIADCSENVYCCNLMSEDGTVHEALSSSEVPDEAVTFTSATATVARSARKIDKNFIIARSLMLQECWFRLPSVVEIEVS